MEHKIFYLIRNKIQIPFIIRLIIGTFCILFSSIPIILPIFPGSLLVGVFILALGFLFIVPGKKIKHVIKIRKGIVYLVRNFHKKRIIEHKMKDIKSHVMKILKIKKYYNK